MIIQFHEFLNLIFSRFLLFGPFVPVTEAVEVVASIKPGCCSFHISAFWPIAVWFFKNYMDRFGQLFGGIEKKRHYIHFS